MTVASSQTGKQSLGMSSLSVPGANQNERDDGANDRHKTHAMMFSVDRFAGEADEDVKELLEAVRMSSYYLMKLTTETIRTERKQDYCTCPQS